MILNWRDLTEILMRSLDSFLRMDLTHGVFVRGRYGTLDR